MFVKLMIEDLMDDGKLKSAGRSRYAVPNAEEIANSDTHSSKLNPQSSSLIGKVDFVNPNFGFIRYDDEQSDIYVSKDDMNGALDGDTVKVRITKPAKHGDKNPEGEVLEIITRGRNACSEPGTNSLSQWS